MLEFIVLGQIPGTPFQITLAWFLFGVLVGLAWFDIKFHVSPDTKKQLAKRLQVGLHRVRA